MNYMQVGRLWNRNADTWTTRARAGYDVYRDYLNAPAFFGILPDVRGLVGLDIGCGEGHNTRLLAKRGARMSAVDISEVFIRHALDMEQQEPMEIDYQVANAAKLPFPASTFHFATAFMSIMDIPETKAVFPETYRVLKVRGFLQFSISHPQYGVCKSNLTHKPEFTIFLPTKNEFLSSSDSISRKTDRQKADINPGFLRIVSKPAEENVTIPETISHFLKEVQLENRHCQISFFHRARPVASALSFNRMRPDSRFRYGIPKSHGCSGKTSQKS